MRQLLISLISQVVSPPITQVIIIILSKSISKYYEDGFILIGNKMNMSSIFPTLSPWNVWRNKVYPPPISLLIGISSKNLSPFIMIMSNPNYQYT